MCFYIMFLLAVVLLCFISVIFGSLHFLLSGHRSLFYFVFTSIFCLTVRQWMPLTLWSSFANLKNNVFDFGEEPCHMDSGHSVYIPCFCYCIFSFWVVTQKAFLCYFRRASKQVEQYAKLIYIYMYIHIIFVCQPR